jgi:hypothetical protein
VKGVISLTTGNVEQVASVRVGLRRKRRKKTPIPLDVVLEQPFVRVTRSRVQLTMTRDTLAALDRPTYLQWRHDSAEGLIELRAVDRTAQDAFVVSYGKTRPSAVVTIPVGFRPILAPGKYMVIAWSDKDTVPKWVRFGTQNQLIRLQEGGNEIK